MALPSARFDGTTNSINAAPTMTGRFGFFVSRRDPELSTMGRIEVAHVTDTPGIGMGTEDRAAWFYVAAGSGVYLSLDALRAYGRVVQTSKAELAREGINKHGIDSEVSAYMDKHGIAVLMFAGDMKAGESQNPVAEIAVRRVPAWELAPPHSGCTVPDLSLIHI